MAESRIRTIATKPVGIQFIFRLIRCLEECIKFYNESPDCLLPQSIKFYNESPDCLLPQSYNLPDPRDVPFFLRPLYNTKDGKYSQSRIRQLHDSRLVLIKLSNLPNQSDEAEILYEVFCLLSVLKPAKRDNLFGEICSKIKSFLTEEYSLSFMSHFEEDVNCCTRSIISLIKFQQTHSDLIRWDELLKEIDTYVKIYSLCVRFFVKDKLLVVNINELDDFFAASLEKCLCLIKEFANDKDPDIVKLRQDKLLMIKAAIVLQKLKIEKVTKLALILVKKMINHQVDFSINSYWTNDKFLKLLAGYEKNLTLWNELDKTINDTSLFTALIKVTIMSQNSELMLPKLVLRLSKKNAEQNDTTKVYDLSALRDALLEHFNCPDITKKMIEELCFLEKDDELTVQEFKDVLMRGGPNPDYIRISLR